MVAVAPAWRVTWPAILAQTDGLVERWVRWERALSTPPVSEQLPPQVRSGIKKVAKAAQELRRTAQMHGAKTDSIAVSEEPRARQAVGDGNHRSSRSR